MEWNNKKEKDKSASIPYVINLSLGLSMCYLVFPFLEYFVKLVD